MSDHLLKTPRYFGGGWYSTRTNWQPIETFKLDILCEADADIEGSADALGRAPTTLAWKARELGLTLPSQWSRLIAPKRKRAVKTPVSADLVYPYIAKPRAEHADIMEINAMIPKGIPDHMRSDMCQEIMLAIMEGRTTLEMLRAKKASSSYFIRKFYKDNFEQSGYALSFDAKDDDGRSYDEIASSIAAKDWHHGQVMERERFYHARQLPFTPPTQFQAAWKDQIGRVQLSLDQLGQFMSRDEVEEMLDAYSAE